MILLCLLTIPYTPVETTTVDVCEINHVYSGNGDHILSQVIWYDWDDSGRYHVRDWRLINRAMPRPLNGDVLFRGERGLLRVRGRSCRETWTQHDPELYERNVLPQCERRKLP